MEKKRERKKDEKREGSRGREGHESMQVQLSTEISVHPSMRLYLITLVPPSCFSGWKVALCLEKAVSILHTYVLPNL